MKTGFKIGEQVVVCGSKKDIWRTQQGHALIGKKAEVLGFSIDYNEQVRVYLKVVESIWLNQFSWPIVGLEDIRKVA